MSSLRSWLGRQPTKPQHWVGGRGLGWDRDCMNFYWAHKCARGMFTRALGDTLQLQPVKFSLDPNHLNIRLFILQHLFYNFLLEGTGKRKADVQSGSAGAHGGATYPASLLEADDRG